MPRIIIEIYVVEPFGEFWLEIELAKTFIECPWARAPVVGDELNIGDDFATVESVSLSLNGDMVVTVRPIILDTEHTRNQREILNLEKYALQAGFEGYVSLKPI